MTNYFLIVWLFVLHFHLSLFGYSFHQLELIMSSVTYQRPPSFSRKLRVANPATDFVSLGLSLFSALITALCCLFLEIIHGHD